MWPKLFLSDISLSALSEFCCQRKCVHSLYVKKYKILLFFCFVFKNIILPPQEVIIIIIIIIV